MIVVEGYKAFRGTLRVTPKDPKYEPMDITGDWLYKPEYGCWYGCGRSFAAFICEVKEDLT